MSRQTTSCHVMYLMSRHATSCHVTSCHVMSCHVMSRLAPSCHVMSHQSKYDRVHWLSQRLPIPYRTAVYDLVCLCLTQISVTSKKRWIYGNRNAWRWKRRSWIWKANWEGNIQFIHPKGFQRKWKMTTETILPLWRITFTSNSWTTPSEIFGKKRLNWRWRWGNNNLVPCSWRAWWTISRSRYLETGMINSAFRQTSVWWS